MKAGIIGAGRLGCAIAVGLKNKGFEISGVYSRSDESAGFLCGKLGLELPNCMKQTVQRSDIIFITVPDAVIENMANSIAGAVAAPYIKGKTFFHCSGALDSDTLKVLSLAGAGTASLHPVQTFAGRDASWKGLDNIYYGFEGDSCAKEKAEAIVKAFGSRLLMIGKEDKPLYHAAACILSNYLVTLSYMAGKLFDNIGIDAAAGIRAFTPLVEKTVKNIKDLGSIEALTGPISRGDYAVVEKHVKDMELRLPEAALLYKTLGKITAEAALVKGSIDKEIADRIIGILD